MTKKEFIDALRLELRLRGVKEIEDILYEFDQHFILKQSQGYSEQEIAEKLGDPFEIAKEYTPGEMEEIEIIEDSELQSVSLNLFNMDVDIHEGDGLDVKSDDNALQIENNDGHLSIRNDGPFGLVRFMNVKHKVEISLPHGCLKSLNVEIVGKLNVRNIVADEVKVDSGTSPVIMDNLEAERVSLDIGAGSFQMMNSRISESMTIDGGAGSMKIENSVLTALDIDMGAGSLSFDHVFVDGFCTIDGGVGSAFLKDCVIENLTYDGGVGSFNYSGQLNGHHELDLGIGSCTLNLEGKETDYAFKCDTSFTLNGRKVSGNVGQGPARIKVDSGIGKVSVSTK